MSDALPSRGAGSLDLATLSAPGTISRGGRLYGTVIGARGRPGRRYFMASLPAGSAVFPLAAPGVLFFLVEEDDASDGTGWLTTGNLAPAGVDSWYRALLSSPGLATDDAAAIPLSPRESRTLDAGRTVTARQVLWLKADRAVLRYATGEDPGAAPALPLLVLADQVTAVATADATVQALTSEALASAHPDILALPLPSLAARMARHLQTHDERLEARPGERQARDSENVRRALGRLGAAAALRPVPVDAAPATGDDLANALAAIARHEGFTLRADPAASRDDPLAARLERLGSASGFRVRQIDLDGAWWKEEGASFVALTRKEGAPRAVVWRRRGWRLVEPDGVRETDVDATVAAGLEPVGLMVYPALPEPATLRTVGRFAFFGTRRDIRFIFVGAVGTTLTAFLIPIATGAVVGIAVPEGRLSLLLDMMILLTAAAIGNLGFHIVRAISVIRLGSAIDRRLQPAVWDRLLRLRTSFFRGYTAGDLAARVGSIDTIRRVVGGFNLSLLIGSLFGLASLAIMLIYDSTLTAFAVGYAVVAGAVLVLQGRRSLRLNAIVLERKGMVTGLLMQILGGMAKLRVAAAEQRAFALWLDAFTRQRTADGKAGIVSTWDVVISTSLPVLGTLGVLAIAGGGDNPVDVASFAAFNGAFAQFTAAIVNLAAITNSAISVAPLLDRVRPIFEAPLEVDVRRADPGRLSGHLAVRNLWFRYGEEGPWILQDVDFEVRPGASVAIVGSSGSGKSTLLRLLLGFEEPQRGGVYYDGKDLETLDLRGVRRQIGTVLEKAGLVPGTLLENITASADVSREQVMEAVRLAGLEGDVAAMPLGLDTLVTEGGSLLSGGQRQRIMIARALVNRPRLVMFDEATSALDNRTQAIVGRSLDGMNATRLVIAHRLSTIRTADHILVLEAGRIVQQGSFDELVAQDGPFLRLVRRQML